MKRSGVGALVVVGSLLAGGGAGASSLALGHLAGVQHGVVSVAVKNYTLTAGGRWCATLDAASSSALSFVVSPTRGAHGPVHVLSLRNCVTVSSAQSVTALKINTTLLANGTHHLVLEGTSRHAGAPLRETFTSVNAGGYVGTPAVLALPGTHGVTLLVSVAAQRVSRVILHWGTPADRATSVMRPVGKSLYAVKLTGVISHSYLTFSAVGSSGNRTVQGPSVVFLTPKL